MKQTGGGHRMSKVIELTDEQYRTLAQAAAARGQTLDAPAANALPRSSRGNGGGSAYRSDVQTEPAREGRAGPAGRLRDDLGERRTGHVPLRRGATPWGAPHRLA